MHFWGACMCTKYEASMSNPVARYVCSDANTTHNGQSVIGQSMSQKAGNEEK